MLQASIVSSPSYLCAFGCHITTLHTRHLPSPRATLTTSDPTHLAPIPYKYNYPPSYQHPVHHIHTASFLTNPSDIAEMRINASTNAGTTVTHPSRRTSASAFSAATRSWCSR